MVLSLLACRASNLFFGRVAHDPKSHGQHHLVRRIPQRYPERQRLGQSYQEPPRTTFLPSGVDTGLLVRVRSIYRTCSFGHAASQASSPKPMLKMVTDRQMKSPAVPGCSYSLCPACRLAPRGTYLSLLAAVGYRFVASRSRGPRCWPVLSLRKDSPSRCRIRPVKKQPT